MAPESSCIKISRVIYSAKGKVKAIVGRCFNMLLNEMLKMQ